MQIRFWNLHQFMFSNFFTLPERNSLRFRQFCWKISKTYSEFQIPSDSIKLHPLICLQVVSALSTCSKNSDFFIIFYMKVGHSKFLRGASQKASIAHLCTLHHEWYQGSLLLPGRFVLLLYHHLNVCFAKRMIVFD